MIGIAKYWHCKILTFQAHKSSFQQHRIESMKPRMQKLEWEKTICMYIYKELCTAHKVYEIWNGEHWVYYDCVALRVDECNGLCYVFER